MMPITRARRRYSSVAPEMAMTPGNGRHAAANSTPSWCVPVVACQREATAPTPLPDSVANRVAPRIRNRAPTSRSAGVTARRWVSPRASIRISATGGGVASGMDGRLPPRGLTRTL